jgi:HAD superfamily hydrolase (TIGR01509 family)
MGIDLVIFDCDGVLVDSEGITTRVYIACLAELGLTWRYEDAVHRFRGGKLADVVAQAEADLGGPLPEGFTQDFRERLFTALQHEIEPIPGIVEVLDALPYPTCVASNGPRAKMAATLGSTGLMPQFEGRIFSAYDVGSFKPEPGLFLHAAASLGARAERCVVVEDSDGGVRAAVAAGMHALAFDAHGANLEAAGATKFTDMRALPGLLADIAAR